MKSSPRNRKLTAKARALMNISAELPPVGPAKTAHPAPSVLVDRPLVKEQSVSSSSPSDSSSEDDELVRKAVASSSSSSSSYDDTSSDESDSEVVVPPLVVTTAGKGSMARGFSPGGGGGAMKSTKVEGGNRAAIAQALSGQQAGCIFSTALQRNPELGFSDLVEKQSVHVNGKSSFLCSQPAMTVKGTGYIAKVIAECHDLNALLFLSESDPRVAGWVASTRAGGVFRFIVDNAALTTGVGDAATWVVLKNAWRMELVERLPSVSLRDISTPGYGRHQNAHPSPHPPLPPRRAHRPRHLLESARSALPPAQGGRRNALPSQGVHWSACSDGRWLRGCGLSLCWRSWGEAP